MKLTKLSARLMSVVAIATLASLTLAGCAANTNPSTGANTTPTPSAGTGSDLTGNWLVSETKTDADGTVVSFNSEKSEFTISAECGQITGTWQGGDDSSFLATVTGWSTKCGTTTNDGDQSTIAEPQLTAWINSTASFEVLEGNMSMLNATGTTIAVLTPLHLPGSSNTAASSDSASASSNVTIPTDATPATRTQIVGRWTQEAISASVPQTPFIEFYSNGTWQGSDGCNDQSGRWIVDGNGTFLATADQQAVITCSGQTNIAAMVTGATFVGVYERGMRLIFFSANATPLIALVSPAATATK